jgi:molybdenum cofactor guanylyltransferase
MTYSEDAAVIILAGGLSTRMRVDKASLALGDSTLLGSLIDRFSRRFATIIVVQRPEQNLTVGDAVIAHDVFHSAGPLGGIHSGLLASPHEKNVVVACDMPFADPAVAHYLISVLGDHDAVIPMLERGPEPLFAAYKKAMHAHVEKALESRSFKVRDFLDSVDTLYVAEDDIRNIDPELRCFLNINTPDDYEKLTRLI